MIETVSVIVQWIAAALIAAGVTFAVVKAGVRYVRSVVAGEGGAASPPAAVAFKDALLWACAAFASRLVIYAFSLLIIRFSDQSHAFSDMWVRWDAANYLSIASEGYHAHGDKAVFLVFFPMYPLLIRAFMFITRGDAFWAAIIASNLCYAAAAGLLYALVRGRRCKMAGRMAVLWLIAWPTSFFNAAPMSEPLFLVLCAACLLLMDRGHLLWAGAVGALCAFTRSPGIVIALPIVLRGLRVHSDGKRRVWQGVLGAAIAVLGLVAYLAVNYYVTGDPLRFLTIQREHWSQQAGFFWETVRTTVAYMFFLDDNFFYIWLPQLISMTACTAVLVAAEREMDAEFVIYFAALFVVSISPTWLLSGSRYIMGILPLYIVLGGWSERHPGARIPLLAISGALLFLYVTPYIWFKTVM